MRATVHVGYSVCENIAHMEQAERDAVAWHDAMGHFKSESERQAFRAGFRKAWSECRSMFALHAGVSLLTKARGAA